MATHHRGFGFGQKRSKHHRTCECTEQTQTDQSTHANTQQSARWKTSSGDLTGWREKKKRIQFEKGVMLIVMGGGQEDAGSTHHERSRSGIVFRRSSAATFMAARSRANASLGCACVRACVSVCVCVCACLVVRVPACLSVSRPLSLDLSLSTSLRG